MSSYLCVCLTISYVLLQISRVTKQYLKLMLRKPVLCIQDLNPMLFRYLEELNDVKVSQQSALVRYVDHLQLIVVDSE